jgi:hypothetical protein
MGGKARYFNGFTTSLVSFSRLLARILTDKPHQPKPCSSVKKRWFFHVDCAPQEATLGGRIFPISRF